MKNILITISLMIATSAMFAQEKNFIDQNYIEISASAEKEVSPDEIYLSITITEKDNKGQNLEKQEKELFKRLMSLGIDLEKDMQIKDMSTLLQEYFLKKNSVVTSKSYQLKVTNTDLLIKVFSALEKLSIPNVVISKTKVSNEDQIKNEVMVMAANEAKESATQIAKAMGRKLGKVIYIQCNESAPRNISARGMMKVMNAMTEDSYSAPDLSYEKIKFEQTIFVRFAIE